MTQQPAAMDGTARQVWERVVEAETSYRYYTYLASKYQVRDRVYSGLAILGSLATAVLIGIVFVAGLDDKRFLLEISSLVVAVASLVAAVFTYTSDFRRNGSIADLASRRYHRLSLRWRQLWYESIRLEKTAVHDRAAALLDEELLTSAEIDCVPLDNTLTIRAASETDEFMKSSLFSLPRARVEAESASA